jgi:hypothetical protein
MMSGKKGQGRKVERPYGMKFRVKGLTGPITTEKWFENRSDRDRAFGALKSDFGTKLISSKKLGK